LDLLRLRKTRASVSLSEPAADHGHAAAEPAPDRLVFGGQVQQRISEALERLTPLERTAFTLRHLEDRTIEEIGSVLKLGGNAAKQTVFRAVQKMRRALQPVAGEAAWRA
ncbi:MAG TPA: sigma factor-like helix-turn-helix DNA-binding protein, partial [Bryobacteraceae bacterium]|nr:sigma factor-like helix-turn-helix DNA-binding protein [Bryobacteraceae bacterium]